jgi:CBS domain-containing protein
MGTKVRDAMTPGVQCLTRSQSLADAARLMRENDVGAAPVTDGGLMVGMLTDRDIVVRAVAEGRDPNTATVGEIASDDVLSVDPDEDLDTALRLMAEHQVRRLPVVAGGRVAGMLAQADVAVVASEKKAGEMLEEISQPTSVARS